MLCLREHLLRAQREAVAIGHFNVADLVLLKSVFAAAQELRAPVLVGVSEGEREFVGVRQIAVMVRSLREEFEFPIFLNADHTHSLEGAIAAARAGFDAIAFDRSALPFEQNVRETASAVGSLKTVNPNILVEGEIGDIGTGSEIHKEFAAARRLTTPSEAKQFVDATRVDILAPAVGNMHGLSQSMVRGEATKRLDIVRISEIASAVSIPLTLHGGSGTDDGDLRSAIGSGIRIVHINTELRVAWRRGLEAALSKYPDQVVPYKILPFVIEGVKQVVSARLQLFNGRPGATKKEFEQAKEIYS